MQEAREIADRVQRAFGERARGGQGRPASPVRLDRPFRHRQFHLDGRQRLTDLVVQFARNRPPLVFLRADQLRRQPLQVGAVPRISFLLDAELFLQRRDPADCRQPDAEAGNDREPELRPDPLLRRPVQRGRGRLLVDVGASIQLLHFIRHLYRLFALRHDPVAEEQQGVGLPLVLSPPRTSRTVARNSSMRSRSCPMRTDSDELSMTGSYLGKGAIADGDRLVELEPVIDDGFGIRIEQGVADVNGGQEHLAAHRGHARLGPDVALGHPGRIALEFCDAPAEVVAREQPQARVRPKPRTRTVRIDRAGHDFVVSCTLR